MLEKILSLDTKLLIFLNELGSEKYDGFWFLITKQIYWTPFFILLLYLIFKKIGIKQGLIVLVFVAILITVNDQTTNLIRLIFKRLRPCNDPEINKTIRLILLNPLKMEYYRPIQYSFVSGHASNSMATMLFIYLLMRKYYKYIGLVFIFPLVFAYSRIYCGVHYPIDILGGYIYGGTLGFAFYKLYGFLQTRKIIK